MSPASPSHRRERLNAQLRQELALALSQDVKDPRLSLVSVLEVDCAPDLSVALVRVSSLGDDAERRRNLVALKGMTGYLRHLLGDRLENLRRVPRLDFRLDDSIIRGTRVNQLLTSLASEPGAAADD
jgi:ribosome-binding factor A